MLVIQLGSPALVLDITSSTETSFSLFIAEEGSALVAVFESGRGLSLSLLMGADLFGVWGRRELDEHGSLGIGGGDCNTG